MMTISEAIKILKSIAPPLDIETFRKTAKCYEALDIAIKALEQESVLFVLNKVKEEIKDNTYFINETTEKEGIDFETVEKIIDKYATAKDKKTNDYGSFCEDWYDILSDEMTLEQARQAVRDLRKKPAEHLEQEPCEDAISRREAIKKFTYSWKGERIPDYDCDNFPIQVDIKTVKEILKGLPPVIPQPKTGHLEWTPYTHNPNTELLGDWICSECKSVAVECVRKEEKDDIPLYKWCPQCGAKMVES